MADPGFPMKGADPFGGAPTPIADSFWQKCKNWVLGRGHAGSAPWIRRWVMSRQPWESSGGSTYKNFGMLHHPLNPTLSFWQTFSTKSVCVRGRCLARFAAPAIGNSGSAPGPAGTMVPCSPQGRTIRVWCLVHRCTIWNCPCGIQSRRLFYIDFLFKQSGTCTVYQNSVQYFLYIKQSPLAFVILLHCQYFAKETLLLKQSGILSKIPWNRNTCLRVIWVL